VDEMEFMIAVPCILLLCWIVMYDYLEVSTLKYGILKALATQSKDVDRALKNLLKSRDDCKILNNDFKRIENIYLTSLNSYLIQHSDTDIKALRREILKIDNFEL
jgi:hypothetical protein